MTEQLCGESDLNRKFPKTCTRPLGHVDDFHMSTDGVLLHAWGFSHTLDLSKFTSGRKLSDDLQFSRTPLMTAE